MFHKEKPDYNRKQYSFYTIDELVPQDHFLRQVDSKVDFDFIYDLVEDTYSPDNGRPSLDSVMLVKIPLIKCFYGIRSMRQTIKEIEVNIIPVFPYTRPKGVKGNLRPSDFVYDASHDSYVCPENQVLNYRTTTLEGYREYKSNPKVCFACPLLSVCTQSKNFQKVVTRHVWKDNLEFVGLMCCLLHLVTPSLINVQTRSGFSARCYF